MIEERILTLLGEVDDKFIEEADPEKSSYRKYKWRKIIPFVACAAVLIMGVRIAYEGRLFNRENEVREEEVTEGAIDMTDTKEEAREEAFSKGQGVDIRVNYLKDLTTADMDVVMDFYYGSPEVDKESENFEENPVTSESMKGSSFLEDFERANHMSCDDFTSKLSKEWVLEKFYSLSSRGEISDSYKVHDYVFEYKKEDGGRATIAMCNFEKPLRDWFIDGGNAEISRVNAVEMKIFSHGKLFIADFNYRGIYYDITTKDVPIEELEGLLLDLVN